MVEWLCRGDEQILALGLIAVPSPVAPIAIASKRARMSDSGNKANVDRAAIAVAADQHVPPIRHAAEIRAVIRAMRQVLQIAGSFIHCPLRVRARRDHYGTNGWIPVWCVTAAASMRAGQSFCPL